MSDEQPDHTLEFLIGFNGRRHYFEDGSFLKFEIKKVRRTKSRLHGLAYSFSLHDPEGERLLGFDNAHSVRAPSGRNKRAVEADHWHRGPGDKGVPYKFESAEKLLDDLFDEVEKVLAERGVGTEVVKVTERKK
jgi:hypothetical protein